MSLFYKNYIKNLISIGILLISGLAFADPQGANTVSGDIKIETAGTTTTINQNSPKAIVDWQSFNVATSETVQFVQPSSKAVILNRVVGDTNPSSILGSVKANGQVFLLNPSGVIFGAGSSVDVAGLVATTGKIDNAKFLSEKYTFAQDNRSGAGVVNEGHITVTSAAENGFVCLAGSTVRNSGTIEAKLGKVVLAAAPLNSTYIVDFHGDQLIQFATPKQESVAIDNAITQNGKILAPGSKVLLAAGSAKNVVDNAINVSGIIEADTISNVKGAIILSAGESGTAEVTGKIHARGEKTKEQGGTVAITGKNIGLLKDSIVDVSGKSGGGEAMLTSTNAIYTRPDAKISASATNNGTGGNIIIKADKSVDFHGTAISNGGALGGDGGFIETSSKNIFNVNGAKINASAPKGKAGQWLIDPYDIYINSTPPTTANYSSGIYSNPNYAVGAGIYINDLLTNLNTTDITIATQNGGDINLNTNLNYTGSRNTTLALNSNKNINLNYAVSGTNLQLVLEALGSTNINQDINIGGLLVNNTASGTTYINTGNITTQSSQTYLNPVILGTDVNLKAVGANSDIIFGKTIAVEKNYILDLSLNATNEVTLFGAVGAPNQPLSQITINANGPILTNDNLFADSLYIQTNNDFVADSDDTLTASVIDIKARSFFGSIKTNILTLDISLDKAPQISAYFGGSIRGETGANALDFIGFVLPNVPSRPGMFYFNSIDLYSITNSVLLTPKSPDDFLSDDDSFEFSLYEHLFDYNEPDSLALSENADAALAIELALCD